MIIVMVVNLTCAELERLCLLYGWDKLVIKLSKNLVMHQRTKHIDVRYHYLRNLSTNGSVRLVFCGTEDQVADIMTKPIKLDQFVKFRDMLGVRQLE